MGNTAPPKVRWHLLSDRFTASVLRGDDAELRRQILRLQRNHVPVREILTRLFVPAARAVGDAWADGEVTVAEEHRATEILTRLMGELNPRTPGRRRGTVVVATHQDEHHTLPTTMAATALREDRWAVEHLGSGVPARGLVRFATDAQADLVVLSVAVRELVDPSLALARAIEREGIQTLVGAPGRTLDELCALATGRVAVAR